MKPLILLLLLTSCTTWNSNVYYQGIRDGSYSGCIYTLDAKNSDFGDDLKLCREVYEEWEAYRQRLILDNCSVAILTSNPPKYRYDCKEFLQ